jgi:hypothetical protein
MLMNQSTLMRPYYSIRAAERTCGYVPSYNNVSMVFEERAQEADRIDTEA